jgi:membrane-associated phospholipid phosphatase
VQPAERPAPVTKSDDPGEETTAGPPRASGLAPWPLDRRAWAELFLAYMSLVLLGLGFAWLLLDGLDGSALSQFDNDAAFWFERLRDEASNGLTAFGSALADTFNVIGALILLMVAFVWRWRRWREALTLGLALGVEALVFLTVSLTVGRERPPVEQLDVSPPTASFPSGHTGAAFALYVGLAVIVFWNTKNLFVRALAVIAAVLLPLSVAISRLYRGMHYFSDVLVGAVLGVLCVVIAAGIVDRAIERRRSVE